MKKSIRQNHRTYSDSFAVAYAERYAAEHQISKEKALQIIITEWLPVIAQYALGLIDNINFNPCPLQNSSVQNIVITDCAFNETKEEKEEKEEKEKNETKKEEIKEDVIHQNMEPIMEIPKEEDIQLLDMLVKNNIALGKQAEETVEKIQGNFSFDVSPYVQERYAQKPKSPMMPLTDEETSMFVV